MSRNKKTRLRGLAEPYLTKEPLFIRACSAFVENLAMILRVALVVGGIFLVRELPLLLEQAEDEQTQQSPAVAESDSAPTTLIEEEDEVLTPGVLRALNCTYKDFRDANYDDCVDDQSEVYRRPGADPDDAGFILADADTLYASTTDSAANR